jgi:hypothetical protein
VALGAASDDARPVLQDAVDRTTDIWKRSGHALPGDAGALADLARAIDTLRLKQPR